MSSHGEPWLEKWGTALVIVFGLVFLAILVSFKPTW